MPASHSLWKLDEDFVQCLHRDTEFIESILRQFPHSLRGGFVASVADFLHSTFNRTGSTDDLDLAITMYQRALEAMPEDSPDRLTIFSKITCDIQRRPVERESLDDMNRVIGMYERVVALSPRAWHPNSAIVLHDLGVTLTHRFLQTGSVSDLDYGARTLEQALARMPNDHSDRAMCCNDLGTALLIRHKQTDSMIDLERAIIASEEAVSLTPKDDPNYSTYISNFAHTLESRFKQTKSINDLNRAITIREQAMASNSDDLNCLDIASSLLKARFDLEGSLSDLDGTISIARQIVALIPNDHPKYNFYLLNLSLAFETRFERTQSIHDLNHAISAIVQGDNWIPDGDDPMDPIYSLMLNTLHDLLLYCFDIRESANDLDHIIKITEQIAVLLPEDCELSLSRLSDVFQLRFKPPVFERGDLDQTIATLAQAGNWIPNHLLPGYAVMLNTLGHVFLQRYEKKGSMDDLNHAITFIEQTVVLTPEADARWAPNLQSLSNALKTRFECTESMTDINRAIKAVEDVLVLAPDNCSYLTTLSLTLLSRFKLTRSFQDLERAIPILEQIVSLSNNNSLDNAAALNNLSTALLFRHVQRDSVDDLKRSIAASERAVALTPMESSDSARYLIALSNAYRLNSKETTIERGMASISSDNPNYALYLCALSNLLQTRFEQSGSLDDLEIVKISAAIRLTPNHHPELPTRMHILGGALKTRSERLGSTDDLDRAIETTEQAVALSSISHVNRPYYLNSLAGAYHIRFTWTKSMADLDNAIRAAQQGMTGLPERHSMLAIIKNTLGSLLLIKFLEIRIADDLDHGIALLDQAVTSTSQNDIYHAGYLANLGTALHWQFEENGSMEVLDRAISVSESALQLVSKDSPLRTVCLFNLACALRSRFQQRGVADDLEQAIQSLEEAIDSTPDDTPDRVLYLHHLGDSWHNKFILTGSTDDLVRALARQEQAAHLSMAPPSSRILAALSASRLIVRFGQDIHRSKDLLRMAVELFPTVSPRTLGRSDQQRNVSKFTSLTPFAVSMHLECGAGSYDALQLLELGRGILASLQIEVRSDISALETAHPELARRFENLRNKLDQPARDPVQNSFLSDPEGRRNLSKQFTNLVVDIRQLNGFDRFLRGSSEFELKSLAGGGPIVIFNVSEIRSDAFLVTQQSIRSICLPLLTHVDLKDHTVRFREAIKDTGLKSYRNSQHQVKAVLEWLWDVAVEPILDELGFSEPQHPDARWPRVWWVPSGYLNVLPIHAAGYHEPGSTRNAINRVISSYVSTVKSLAYAQERDLGAVQIKSQKAMLIGMPKTPGKTHLPFVEREIKELQELMPQSIQKLGINNPTKEEVLSNLRDQQVVHFSCHGYADAANPSQSRLLLCDWETAPLNVSDLTSLNLQMPQFAYLSACHTASARDFELLDESINLATAVQLAGYPSVVGSLWYVMDQESVQIAKDVYSHMLDGDKLDNRRAAEGLHHAVRALRDRTRIADSRERKVPDDPLVWAPYIHLGV